MVEGLAVVDGIMSLQFVSAGFSINVIGLIHGRKEHTLDIRWVKGAMSRSTDGMDSSGN